MVALIVSDVVFMFGGNLWWTFQSLYILDLGASKEILGMLFMFQTITTLAFQFPAGIAADRLGRKKLILWGAFIRCIPPLIYLAANHWTFFIPGMLVNALSSIDIPAWNALVIESLPLESRGAGYSLYRTLTAISGVFMMPLGGILLDLMGVVPGTRLCLMVNEVMMITYTGILWRFITETKREGEARETETHEKREALTTIQKLRTLSRGIWVLMVIGGLSSFAIRLSSSFTIVYATQVIGLSKTEWGIIGTFVSLISITITTPAGFLGDRIGRKPCILFSQSLSLVSTFLFINLYNFSGILFSRSLEGVATGFGGLVTGETGGSNWQALIADFVPSERRGSIMGLIGTIIGALGAPSPWVGGYLYENLSPILPFQLNIALRAVAVLIFLLLLKEPKEKAK
jgi:MFS family permease